MLGRRSIASCSVLIQNMKFVSFVWVVTLTLASQVACGTLNINEGQVRRLSCDFHVYRDLLALGDPHVCTGENQVWRMLDNLYHQTDGPSCMNQVITHLGGQYKDITHSPDYCNCSGSNTLHRYNHVHNLAEHRFECRNDHSYASLYETHFTRWNQNAHAYNCTSHHAIWHILASISSDTCRSDIVLHVANIFITSGEQCSCGQNSSGKEMPHTSHTTNHITTSTKGPTNHVTTSTKGPTNHVTTSTKGPTIHITTSTKGATNHIITSTKGPTDHCLLYESYKYLYNLSLHVQQCVSVNNMWHYLADLQQKDINCRKKIMDHMAAIFHNYSDSPTYCTCTGHNVHHDTVRISNGGQTHCNYNHATYRLLHGEIYEHGPSPCRSHQFLWKKLLDISIGQHEIDCRADLILHAAATFPHTRDDPCSCAHAATSITLSATTHVAGHTTLSHTSSIKPTVTSTTATTTTSNTQAAGHLLGIHVCNKALTISSIAYNHTVTHASASDCTTGDHTSSEALVLQNCNASSTKTWIKGENVKAICNSVPLYTPIATFNDKVFQPIGGKAGIFLGCLPDGFKIAVQDCHVGIQIRHLQAPAIGVNDPANYFIVRW